ncbi:MULTISPECIES: O-antigen ligase family protein [Pseudomonas]|uniref:O-antigen ligase family protein n=1 Tax=Pseudomonas TaxID=286 RepID=UPI0009E60BAF|nr:MULTISPECIES: O-antigen ligase family protein [Pseudomonas]
MLYERRGLLESSFILCLFIFSISALFNFGFYGWHDQQRVAQLFFLLAIIPAVCCSAQRRLPGYALSLIIVIAVFGLISSARASWPEWALKEWGRCLALFIAFVVISGLAQRSSVRVAIFGCMVFVGIVQVFQFLVSYVSAFISGINILHADVLVGGFSNPRFFGQFQVVLLPVLAFLIARFFSRCRYKVAAILMVVLVLHWCVSYVLGGRGMWAATVFSHIFVFIFFRRFWVFLLVQAFAALLGFFVFVVLFFTIPSWFDIVPWLHDGLRAGLSSRDLIWMLSWEIAVDNVWLGIGPMHFSATYNPVAAHPHQVLLQWLSEWGVFSTVLAFFLVGRGLFAGGRVLRSEKFEYEDVGLWTALVSGLLLAQVDGVFVMPYTEMWLAILAGVAFSRWASPLVAGIRQRFVLSILSIPVVIVLVMVLVREAPVLPATEESYLRENPVGWAPRFWEQGWIPMQRYGE